jgi:tetratricopeptide (TPR) repeat protein
VTVRGMVCLLVLAMASPAAASPSKVKKAGKLFEAYKAGERDALAEAWATLDPALAHKKVEGDPLAWVLVAEVQLARGEGDRDRETLASAVRAAERALQLGAEGPAAERAVEVLKSTQGLLIASMVDALASKDHDAAWEMLQAVLQGRKSLAERDIVLRGMEEKLLRTGIIVATKSGHVDEALPLHEAFFGEGWFDAGLASMIAKELGDAERAVAFLAPLREEYPGDERLLRAHVGLLAGSPDDAKAVIDSAKEQLFPSVSGALLLGELYTQVGAEAEALAAYEQVLTLDAAHRDALVAVAADKARRADALAQTLEGPGLSRSERREAKAQLATLRSEVVSLLERAREGNGRDRAVLVALKAAYEANEDADAAIEVQGAIDELESE